MNYELTKELKEAGFPQGCTGNGYFVDNQGVEYKGGEHWKQFNYVPTLSELIEACGADDICLSREDGTWKAMYGNSSEVAVLNEWDGDYCATGNSIEEAVARLWLALNKK